MWLVWLAVGALAVVTACVWYRALHPVARDEYYDNRVILLHLPQGVKGRVEIRQTTADDDPQVVSGFVRGDQPKWYDIYVLPDGTATVEDVNIFHQLRVSSRSEGIWSLRAIDADGNRLPCCFASWQPRDQVAFRLYSTTGDGVRIVLVGDRRYMIDRWPAQSSVVQQMFWADAEWSP